MDTNTKNIVSAIKEKEEMKKVLAILSDVFSDKITEKTIDLTVEIRNISPEYWDNNRWLNMLGNGDFESKDFNLFILNEIELEFSEEEEIEAEEVMIDETNKIEETIK